MTEVDTSRNDAQSGFDRICERVATKLGMPKEEVTTKLKRYADVSTFGDFDAQEEETIFQASLRIVQAQRS